MLLGRFNHSFVIASDKILNQLTYHTLYMQTFVDFPKTICMAVF